MAERYKSQQRSTPATPVPREERKPETPAQEPREFSTQSPAPTNGASVEEAGPTPPAKDRPEHVEESSESDNDDIRDHGSEASPVEPEPHHQLAGRELVASPPHITKHESADGELRPSSAGEDKEQRDARGKEPRSPADSASFSEVQL
ncbi:hypothetical protein MMC06_001270 [Schaereria dolodes]|nr:hypothetical protein [Schaereria dolodes]